MQENERKFILLISKNELNYKQKRELFKMHLLEKKFQLGVLYERTQTIPSIRDIITISCILSFSTSKKGWREIAKGSLTERPDGESDGRHAALIEGYDFDKGLYICKNSWGISTAVDGFDVDLKALHNFHFIKVYWTLNSIKGKTIKQFHSNMEKFIGILNGEIIDCA